MVEKLEITIDVIVHATEDISKIFQSFNDVLEIEENDFTLTETTGYFENIIIILNTKIIKKQAKIFMKKFLKLLSNNQINQLIEEIEERTIDSKFHLRLDKQELVKGKIELSEKDTVRIKIHTPIYNKKDTIKIFSEIFQSQLD
jgi:RNA-binding protein